MKISMAIVSNRSRPYQPQISFCLMLHGSLQGMESKPVAFLYTRKIFPAAKVSKAISKSSFSLLIKGSKWNVRQNKNTDVTNIWSSLLRAYLKAVASRGTAETSRISSPKENNHFTAGHRQKISWALKQQHSSPSLQIQLLNERIIRKSLKQGPAFSILTQHLCSKWKRTGTSRAFHQGTESATFILLKNINHPASSPKI